MIGCYLCHWKTDVNFPQIQNQMKHFPFKSFVGMFQCQLQSSEYREKKIRNYNCTTIAFLIKKIKTKIIWSLPIPHSSIVSVKFHSKSKRLRVDSVVSQSQQELLKLLKISKRISNIWLWVASAPPHPSPFIF